MGTVPLGNSSATLYGIVFEQRLITLALSTFDLSYFTSVNGWDLDL